MKGQKRGRCRKCEGELVFYPKLDLGEPVLDEAGEIVGAWAHVDTRDWVTNPHPPEPEEG